MKKILILLIVVVSAVLLSGCNEKSNVVPLLIYDMNDVYMADFEQKIENNVTSDFTIKNYDCQNSQIIQNEYLDEIFNKGYPLVIINPVDRLSVFAIIEKAKKTNTKIIFINREPLESDLNLSDSVYYIGAKAQQSAEMQAEIIMKLFGPDPYNLNSYDKNGDNRIQAVILKGEQGHQDAEERTKYVVQTLEDNNYKVDLLDTVIANFDRNQAYTATQQIITDYGDSMELIIANNDAMALGAIDALKEAGYFEDTNNDGTIQREEEPWFPVVGIDGLNEAIQSMNKGYLYGTVLNDSESMAKAIIHLSRILLLNLPLSDFDYTITDDKYVWINYQKIVK